MLYAGSSAERGCVVRRGEEEWPEARVLVRQRRKIDQVLLQLQLVLYALVQPARVLVLHDGLEEFVVLVEVLGDEAGLLRPARAPLARRHARSRDCGKPRARTWYRETLYAAPSVFARIGDFCEPNSPKKLLPK